MSKPMTPLTVAQLQQHPEFKNAFWDLKPTEKGKVNVAMGRGGPFKIDYEIHGHGEHRIVVSPITFSLHLSRSQ